MIFLKEDISLDIIRLLKDRDKIVVEDGKWARVLNTNGNLFIPDYIGVVGIIKNCFLQIIIFEDSRGQGYLKKIIDKVIRYWRLDKLYATINKDNIQSIKAFKKLGYKEVKEGKIPPNHIRLKIL